MRAPKTALSMIGKRFHRWNVVALNGATAQGIDIVTCRCKCGTVKDVQATSLTRRKNMSKSCGCLRAEIHTTHGATTGRRTTPEYRAWFAMKYRCYTKTFCQFQDYGGRGITVCDRWRDSFENFLADMGPRPSKAHSLDRFPDVNGNYGPSNCRWATNSEKHRNRRNNRLITHDGETRCLTAWAEAYGIQPTTLHGRLKRGIPISAALTTKLHTRLAKTTNNL